MLVYESDNDEVEMIMSVVFPLRRSSSSDFFQNTYPTMIFYEIVQLNFSGHI